VRTAPFALLAFVATSAAYAQNALTITEVRVDRPTLHTAGIQVLIAGDANRDATIRVRVLGDRPRDALPLVRVRPETVTGRVVPEQLAGTIFDLEPGQTYEVELIATDPDGGNATRTVTVTTRALPRTPSAPRPVAVANATQLRDALGAARPGDVITLADGTYAGSFVMAASGTPDNPIVIRGTSQAGTILDGGDCGCNVLELSGSHVQVERLTIKNAVRALRFLGAGATGNAVRRIAIADVVHGIGSAPDQSDFTICDNVVHGRLRWPLVSTDDGAAHNDDQGIRVDGSGHVVCHNDIAGFGDPLLNFAEGGRAYDFYGNDIHEIYGDGVELDRAEGNVRLFHNRFTNVFTAISIQPVYGGPAYVVRNQVVNVADEQIKLKSVGGTIEPSGAYIFHNTFVSPRRALNLQTPITQHDFAIANNLFVGPSPSAGRAVEWTAKDDGGSWNYNGYFPDEGYWFGTIGATPRVFADLAAAQAAGLEVDGRVLAPPIFAPEVAPPASYTEQLAPALLALAEASNAIDAGQPLPGINSGAPDLGAHEVGCTPPRYGPRAVSDEAITNLVDCRLGDAPLDPDGPPGDPDRPDGGGCCQTPRDAGGALLPALLLLLAFAARRR
jgi:hypothetical protein